MFLNYHRIRLKILFRMDIWTQSFREWNPWTWEIYFRHPPKVYRDCEVKPSGTSYSLPVIVVELVHRESAISPRRRVHRRPSRRTLPAVRLAARSPAQRAVRALWRENSES